jgi:predicted enzyme related to lactoylglutathione lyase
MKISGTMIASEQPKVLGAFYSEVLGEPGMKDDQWFGFMTPDAGSLMIGGHSEVKGTNDTPARSMLMFETEDVQAEFDRIKGIEGAKVVAEPYQPGEGMWLATFADPDGNYFQLSLPWNT